MKCTCGNKIPKDKAKCARCGKSRKDLKSAEYLNMRNDLNPGLRPVIKKKRAGKH